MKRGGVGISFMGALALMFIFLKLHHDIDWSWWWVLGPIWIPSAVGLAFAVCLMIFTLLTLLIFG